ncbi:hypothetical protein ACI65C_007452 [Semiaphis heraclei]
MKNNRPSTPITKIPKSPIIKKSTIKTVPPPLIISNTLMDQTGDSSPSDLSGNESDWKTVPTNSTKRNRSPNHTSPNTKKTDTNIFISANRFTPIAPTNEVQPMETVETQSLNNDNKTSKPPPIFIQEQINYNNFCQKINELTDTSGFDCKSSTKGRPFPSAELGNLVQSLSFTHIIGADFNAKHQTWSRSTNTRGRTLQNFISLNHLKVIASLSPTYWPSHINRHPDTLDFFITNLPNRFSTEIINLNDPASDHTPVLLQIGAHPSLKKSRPTITPGTTNWNKFKDTISNKTTLNIKLKSITDVDQAIAKLTDDIQKAALDSSTQNPPYSQTLNLSPELRRLIAEKRRARSKWQYTHYPADKIKFSVKQARVLEKTTNLLNYWLQIPTVFSSKRPHILTED